MNCCEKYGDIFNITYNVNKSYCMVIDVLPYTTKCKYLGHIINNNLIDVSLYYRFVYHISLIGLLVYKCMSVTLLCTLCTYNTFV